MDPFRSEMGGDSTFSGGRPHDSDYGHSLYDPNHGHSNSHGQTQPSTQESLKTNLIINYLPQHLTQDDIRTMFSSVGPVKNCKLVRDHTSGVSLGYAFIEYFSGEDAQKAIVKLDKLRLENKTIRVSYSRPSSSDIKNANLYVAGLPSSVDEDKLAALFRPFGAIITHKVLFNEDGTSRGVGFVRFDKREESQKAIDSMNGKTLEGGSAPLTVKYAIPPQVKNLNNQIKTLLGATQQASLRFNPMMRPGAVPGQVPTAAAVAAAAAAMAPQNPVAAAPNLGVMGGLQGPIDQTSRAVGPWCIYVYGLQPTAAEYTLYQLFSPFGAILSVRVMRDLTKPDQPCKGFGFVNFANYHDAHKAVMQLNNFMYDGKTLQVSFKTGGKMK